jgi:hypothetical protein
MRTGAGDFHLIYAPYVLLWHLSVAKLQFIISVFEARTA